MHAYRTHTCGQLRPEQAGETVRLSGWVHRKRDHGNLLFLDLRDHYGLTQCVVDTDSPHFPAAEAVRVESVVTITGTVVKRSAETANDKLPTGGIEVRIDDFVLQSAAQVIPLQVSSDEDAGEDVRLRHRFLDLRRQKMQRNIVLRSEVISSIRRRMIEQGFREFQTPILTASSPEGARDFLVPARQHPGKFYALPQAPQQFKQLLMVAGFDRYFQIAPCFRDEDGRADRSPGEFYQLDFEMSYVTQEDVFQTIEPVLRGVFEEFSDFTGKKRAVTAGPFPRIPYAESMLKYGNDKPDLRNPLVITDVTAVFAREDVTFRAFKGVIEKGGVVRAIRAPTVADRPRSFFDKLNGWAQEQGAPGLGYVVFEAGAGKGPIAKFLEAGAQGALREATGAEDGDAVFFVADLEAAAAKLAGFARTKIGQELELIDPDRYEFCWIVDFPMYELNEETGQIDFSHNPFSMPQGGLEALETQGPADHQRVPVRHRLQRHRAVLGRDPEPQAGDHDQGVRDRRLWPQRARGQVRRHAVGLPLRRPAAWRFGPRHRPHRHAAGGRAEHPRGHRLPDEPARRGSADGRPGRGRRGPAEGAAHQARPAEEGELRASARGSGCGRFSLSDISASSRPGSRATLPMHRHVDSAVRQGAPRPCDQNKQGRCR